MGALGRVHGTATSSSHSRSARSRSRDGRIHLWVGGGIVWDSDPAAEVEESLDEGPPAARGDRGTARPRRGASRAALAIRAPAARRPGRGRTPAEHDRRLPRAGVSVAREPSARRCDHRSWSGRPGGCRSSRPTTRASPAAARRSRRCGSTVAPVPVRRASRAARALRRPDRSPWPDRAAIEALVRVALEAAAVPDARCGSTGRRDRPAAQPRRSCSSRRSRPGSRRRAHVGSGS